jgi:hypothetical protein
MSLRVTAWQLYGDLEAECVGHVNNRLDMRLRKVRKDEADMKLSEAKVSKACKWLMDGDIHKLLLYSGLPTRRI